MTIQAFSGRRRPWPPIRPCRSLRITGVPGRGKPVYGSREHSMVRASTAALMAELTNAGARHRMESLIRLSARSSQ